MTHYDGSGLSTSDMGGVPFRPIHRRASASRPGDDAGAFPRTGLTPPCRSCNLPMLKGETECPRCGAER